MIILGHSIANGVGAADTTYALAPVPGAVEFRNNGSARVTYPDAAGAGSDPGVTPGWAQYLDSLGGGTLIRRAANGALLSQIETQFLPNSIEDCTALGLDRDEVDAVVVMVGENDSQAGESTPFAARVAQTCEIAEAAYPNARVILQRIVTTDAGGYPEYAAVDAAIVAAVAARSTRAASSAAGITTQDTVHYSLAGYAVAWANQIAAYTAAG